MLTVHKLTAMFSNKNICAQEDCTETYCLCL